MEIPGFIDDMHEKSKEKDLKNRSISMDDLISQSHYNEIRISIIGSFNNKSYHFVLLSIDPLS